LLAAVSAKVADINTNIKNMEARTDEDRHARIDMTVEIGDLKHLEKVIKSLRSVDECWTSRERALTVGLQSGQSPARPQT
jgi:(p)ppGpp synthase/HD superfamily hydrolase